MNKFFKKLISVVLALAICLSTYGVASAGWVKTLNRTWSYTDSSGRKVTSWKKINSVWYYFNQSGVMQTGWQYIGNKWYYFNRDGMMQTGWKKINNIWYYLNSSGQMQTGWKLIGNTWYYLNSNGTMKTGWLKSGNSWYYFSPNGPMKTGWVKVNTDWYYMSKDGVMQTGWLSLYGKEYYLLPSGKMATGFHTIDAVSYYFDDNGVLSDDTIAKKTEYEQKVITLINEIRAKENLKPLTYTVALSRAASVRAEEISLKFDHIRPDGSEWYTVFEEVNQDIDGTGENIARNLNTPEDVVAGWMDSVAHKENILNPKFRFIGVGYLKKGSGASYWTQLFSEMIY